MSTISSQKNTGLFSRGSLADINLKHPFFNSHLITYIGNKRRLLPFLYQGFLKIQNKIGKDKLVILDGFAGSGAPARLLKAFASELHVNDLEDYCETINGAYLANRSEVNAAELEKYINWLNENRLNGKSKKAGFIELNYAPKDDNDIHPGERVFYTNKNAKIIDNVRRLIDEQIPENYKSFCLASLLVRASIHNNTSGVFKGFHKKDGVGHFGGQGENALARIKQEIFLDTPIFSDFECPVYVHKRDINELVLDKALPLFDLAYYDPPYNQHPYGSNYFMLNIINEGKPREIQDGVSGIAVEWNRSPYNKQKVAEQAMDNLIEKTNAKFIAISYNDEGIIPINTFKAILSKYGKWELFQQDYNTYRGSRNLRDRSIKVKECLWILEKNPANLQFA
jgi:adenine-specific DNA-methyltransferase